MRMAVSAFLLSAVLATAEGAWEQKFSALGEFVVTPFESAPYPHPSRAGGHKYRDELYPADKHYSDRTVAIFVPPGAGQRSEVDFVVHFHGWRNTVAGTLTQFKLIEQLVASGRDAILVVPQGPREAPDSGGGKLEDADGFKRFMTETLATLQQRHLVATNAKLGTVILSGHSGGYQVISSIVTKGGLSNHVREVWLFDGLYAQTDKFLAWAEKTGGKFLVIYTESGGTKARTEEMMATLKQQGKRLLAVPDLVALPSELKHNQFVFLQTDLEHNEVLAKRRTFETFLRASPLQTRPSN